MGYSLGLTLYLLAARGGAHETGLPGDGPAPLAGGVWLHAGSAGAAQGLAELARRLLAAWPGLPVVFSCPDPVLMPEGVTCCAPPPEVRQAVRGFLDHWRPALAVYSGADLRPALIHEAHRRRLPLLLAQAGAPTVMGGSGRWWPGLVSGLLDCFDHILALDEDAARALRRAGAPSQVVRVAGWLDEGSQALPCTEAEREMLARCFGTRPVWLAAALPEREEDIAALAHQAALRMAHRLLLIVVPADPARGPELAERLEQMHGLTTARRSAETDPDEDTQVYIADTEDEFGLWYRLAPIVYMGGTLGGPACLRQPFEAAALGAAILHGPRLAPHADRFDRLARAGATRRLASATDLGEAVGDLLAPDRAARLAQAAWEATSAGAEATARVLALTEALLPRDKSAA